MPARIRDFKRRSRARWLASASWRAMLGAAASGAVGLQLALPMRAESASPPYVGTGGGTRCTVAASGPDGIRYKCTTSLGTPQQSVAVLSNATNVVNSLTGNVGGSVAFGQPPGQQPVGSVAAFIGNGASNGYPNEPIGPWNNGPSLGVKASNTRIIWSDAGAAPYTGALLVQSEGAIGSFDGIRNQSGADASYAGGAGGDVGIRFQGSVELESIVKVSQGSSPVVKPMLAGIGAYSFGGAGGTYNTNNDCCAGNGGNGGTVVVSVRPGSSLLLDGTVQGVPAVGVAALSAGGNAADLSAVGNHLSSAGGRGGKVGVLLNGASITGDAGEAIGVVAASVGGTGKAANDSVNYSGSASGVAVGLKGTEIALDGGDAVGVLAVSAAGSYTSSSLDPPRGGNVDVLVDKNSSISAGDGSGTLAAGILAISSGTAAVLSPVNLHGSTSETIQATGIGESGDVSVANAAPITTSGTLAVGIAAISAGGAGIVAPATGGGISHLGNSEAGYATTAGRVTLYNSGEIVTQGANAHGLAAISTGGGGLIASEVEARKSGDSWTDGAIVGGGGSGGQEESGHDGGAVRLANSGAVTTGDGSGGGNVAMGIVAQSIGGGGGSASGTALFVGDNGGDGGKVRVANNGAVTTRDKGAVGVLAQSIGGGGGNGANAKGLFVAVGGQGGSGGDGGDVDVELGPDSFDTRTFGPKQVQAGSRVGQARTVTLGPVTVGPGSGTGNIVTLGDYAAGVIAQSIGGGGGNGGYADDRSVFISAVIGGTAGGGGNGGNVGVTNGVTLVTLGNQSSGIIAQSIGGGGGTSGVARGDSTGFGFDASIALGGAGGDGGAGGSVSVTNSGRILTGCPDPKKCSDGDTSSYQNAAGPRIDSADAIGILAQSIGGGGGNAGGATAKSEALPVDGIPTLSASYAMGGKGGTGQSAAEVTVTNNGLLVTGGDGAHGVLAQSIGAGGGNGGDSTTSSAAGGGAMLDFSASVSLGGDGGAAGAGGPVTVKNGNGKAPAGILTFGQNAVGILVQSVGGGGGNGAVGNSSGSLSSDSESSGVATAEEAPTRKITVTISAGGKGGAAGSGGEVEVANAARSGVRTLGSGSSSILAQSIGGGGGNAGGGSSSADGADYAPSVAIGGSGGAAGDGGAVTVQNDGTVVTGQTLSRQGSQTTTGGDGIGILAQSIGGGGGTGGSSDPAASDDGSEDDSSTKAAAEESSSSYKAAVGVGGSGGAAGNGGAVQVTNTGTVGTLGIRAYGILAQSIGGGGGVGGTATSSSASADDGDYEGTLGLGGSDGASGLGGAVTIGNTGSITTAGYAAHAILAQSIGGGGGVAADGAGNSTTTATFGNDGDNPSRGAGSKVTVTDLGSISTAGDDAYGILAQSIGGGGGVGGAGCSNSSAPAGSTQATACFGNSSADDGSTPAWGDGSELRAIFAGQSQSGADGGEIEIGPATGRIVTTGARALGIVAQSIGGGGGLIAGREENLTGIVSGDLQGRGNGGRISITLGKPGADPSATSITTAGDGAYGILAQSIGGGGGFAGDSSLPLSFPIGLPASKPGTSVANGGPIGIDINANIVTTGANAHGIFAQSLGGNAVIAGDGNAVRVSYGTGQPGYGGTIDIEQDGGTISTSGPGSIGIFAHSSGNQIVPFNPITVDIGGSVVGGTGSGAAGIVVSGGSPGGNPNLVKIKPGGSVGTVDGVDGTAIRASDNVTNVVNQGTLVGSVDLDYGTVTAATAAPVGATDATAAGRSHRVGTITNRGTFVTGETVRALRLTNSGTLDISGGGDTGTTHISGDLVQDEKGRMLIDADHAEREVDRITVEGDVKLRGTLKVKPLSLGKRELTVLSAGGALRVDRGFELRGSPVVRYTHRVVGRTLRIEPHLRLADRAGGNERSLAADLQRLWDEDDAAGDRLGTLYATLAAAGEDGDVEETLGQLSGAGLAAIGPVWAATSQDFTAGMNSCPTFAGEGTLLSERECGWGRIVGSDADRDSSGSSPGYGARTLTTQFGGQKAVAPGWFLGGSIAYELSRIDGKGQDNDTDLDGQGVLVGAVLKREAGPLLLSGSLSAGYAWYDSERRIDLATGDEQAEGSPEVANGGLHARAAYELPMQGWYLRPSLDIGADYVRIGSYDEHGASGLDLDLDSSDKLIASATPSLEIGGRVELPDGSVLRPFLSLGASLYSANNWETEARLEDGGSSDEFTTELAEPNLVGRLILGADVVTSRWIDVKLQYGLDLASDYIANKGLLRVGLDF